jgi:AcrR family transcriptional regulator
VSPRISEARRSARRQQIVNAAVVCFARTGFHATSMADIIAESGLSAGAVYTYFASKDDLIAATTEEVTANVADILAVLQSAHEGDTLEDIVLGVLRPLDDYPDVQAKHRIMLHAWGEASGDSEIGVLLHGVYTTMLGHAAEATAAWQARGLISPAADPAQAARVLLSLVAGYIVQTALLGPVDTAGYARAAARLLGPWA